jgi:hypothetical protein
VLAKVTALVVALLQSVWLVTEFTVGVGLTVIVKLCVAPGHKFAEGVTVIVPKIGAFVVFVPLNASMFPEPDANKLIAVFVFVHV